MPCSTRNPLMTSPAAWAADVGSDGLGRPGHDGSSQPRPGGPAQPIAALPGSPTVAGSPPARQEPLNKATLGAGAAASSGNMRQSGLSCAHGQMKAQQAGATCGSRPPGPGSRTEREWELAAALTEYSRIDDGAASAIQRDERADALAPEIGEASGAALPLLLVRTLHRVALQAWEEGTHCSSEAGQRRWWKDAGRGGGWARQLTGSAACQRHPYLNFGAI